MQINFQILIESIGEAIFLLNKNGHIQYCNAAATAITGYSANDLLNRPFSMLNDNPDDNTKVEYQFGMAKKRGKFVSEGWKIKKDDTKFWAETALSPIYDEDGKFDGYSCVLSDKSEKKNTELDLVRSEERYRLMMEGVKDYAIFMLDSNGFILTWNEGARRTKGYLASEAIGKHFSIFYTCEDLDNKKPEMELRVATASGKYQEEGWRVKKNGSVFWANVTITALFNEQNKLIGFSKVTRDVTERKENEEILRENEERYRSLVEQVKDYGIFMMDEKGKIISWNEGAKNIKGYEANEIIGKYFSIFYTEEDLIDGKPAYELRKARTEGKYEEEGWRLRKDGSRFWANIVITPIYKNSGVLIGFSKVTRDLTERKEAEKALKESFERYRQLATELKETNAELLYANQELEQFTSIASHDLQEPVRTIKSFLQLIGMKLKEKQYDGLGNYIDKTLGAATRMRELIQNLLNYSQVGKGEMEEKNVNVNELISKALEDLRISIETTNAEVIVENKLNIVKGDSVHLGQLLQNLISNALKFTNGENPKVKISAYQENNHPQFAIADNGIGIAEDDLDKVFEIFKRLYTEKEYPGTGIGLAICKKIVDRHRGRIWLESKLGKGTTFYFTLNEEPNKSQPI